MNSNKDEPGQDDEGGPDRMVQWFETTRPAEPAEAAWSAALTRIEARLAAEKARRQPWLAAVLVVAAAAALLLTLSLDFSWSEPFPVTSADDVEIISVAGGDHDALVVGEPPLADEPIVLAAHGDATVESVQPGTDGVWPQVHGPEAAPVPMIVVPLTGAAAKE